MTERLYYNDSFLRAFDAQVISCEPEGERWKVILDRTAFYPTSGGQPHDLGTLAGAPVIEVADAEEKIVHYTSAAVDIGPVHAEIDWPRRIDHMQQHTGQHLLSAAFIELFNFPTVSFHLGREVCTIDLTAPAIVPRHIEEAERRTNEIIFEDRVVTVRYGTAQELEEAGVRKKVDREGILRAIEVEGFDRQPCGGTHLARTGQAGLLLTRKLERRRDFWRLEFVCGFRALATARADYANLTQDAALLSCGIPEVPKVLEKLVEERRAQHSAVKRLEEHLAEHEARSLLAANPARNSRRSAPHSICDRGCQRRISAPARRQAVAERSARGRSAGQPVHCPCRLRSIKRFGSRHGRASPRSSKRVSRQRRRRQGFRSSKPFRARPSGRISGQS